MGMREGAKIFVGMRTFKLFRLKIGYEWAKFALIS